VDVWLQFLSADHLWVITEKQIVNSTQKVDSLHGKHALRISASKILEDEPARTIAIETVHPDTGKTYPLVPGQGDTQLPPIIVCTELQKHYKYLIGIACVL